jgi:hypothetical protein
VRSLGSRCRIWRSLTEVLQGNNESLAQRCGRIVSSPGGVWHGKFYCEKWMSKRIAKIHVRY